MHRGLRQRAGEIRQRRRQRVQRIERVAAVVGAKPLRSAVQLGVVGEALLLLDQLRDKVGGPTGREHAADLRDLVVEAVEVPCALQRRQKVVINVLVRVRLRQLVAPADASRASFL